MTKSEIYSTVHNLTDTIRRSRLYKGASPETATQYALEALETYLAELLAGNPLVTIEYFEKKIETLRIEYQKSHPWIMDNYPK
jgi:hypothetical protein